MSIFFRPQLNKVVLNTHKKKTSVSFLKNLDTIKNLNCSTLTRSLLLDSRNLFPKSEKILIEIKEDNEKPDSLRFYKLKSFKKELIDTENLKISDFVSKSEDFLELKIIDYTKKSDIKFSNNVKRNENIELNLSDDFNLNLNVQTPLNHKNKEIILQNIEISDIFRNILLKIFTESENQNEADEEIKTIANFSVVESENRKNDYFIFYRCLQYYFKGYGDVEFKNVGPQLTFKFERLRINGVVYHFIYEKGSLKMKVYGDDEKKYEIEKNN